MDVVNKNLEKIGGTIQVESAIEVGTSITLHIPLTLAIIDGMNIRVGKARYTLPTTTIKESFRASEADIIQDLDGNEMIMIRGNCVPVIRLYRFFNIDSTTTKMEEGIMIMIECEKKEVCIFADELLGEQQVVVKSLPAYIRNIKKIRGISGCTLLGDGSISLILDASGFHINKEGSRS